MEHTINPHLPLDGTGDINSGHIRCGRAPLIPRMLCDCNGDFLATDKGSTANSQLIRTMLTQAAIPRTMSLLRIWDSRKICEDFRKNRSTVFFSENGFRLDRVRVATRHFGNEGTLIQQRGEWICPELAEERASADGTIATPRPFPTNRSAASTSNTMRWTALVIQRTNCELYLRDAE